MLDEQRQRILVLCDESGMGLGGVPVFNEQISMALAARGHDVTLLTARQVQGGHEGVKLRTVQPAPENIEGRHWLEQQVTTQHPTTFGLPDPRVQPFDLVIGHSRFSGPAAVAIRDAWYAEARVTHFLHTSPERLPGFKYPNDPVRAAEKAARDSSIEQVIMNRADVVVGVGPLLTEEARKLASANPQVSTSHELIPGTAIEPLVQRAQQHGGPLQLLALGRADDDLKGFADAARAVKLLNSQGIEVHLTIRGVKEHELAGVQEDFRRYGGAHVSVLPFSTEREAISNDIRQADALVMPSKHEGFGLVATEALGHGVPVLVNEDSGAARFLQNANRFPPQIGDPCVVPEPADPEDRIIEWASAIQQLKEQLPQRIEDAAQLREILKSYSWEHAATSLVQASVTAPAPAVGASAAQRAHATVQGPDGAVLVSAAPPGTPPTQQDTATAVSQTATRTTQVTQQTTQSTQNVQQQRPPAFPQQPTNAEADRTRSDTADRTTEAPNPLAMLSDDHLARHRAHLADSARTLAEHANNAATTAQQLADRYQQDGGQTVARLTAANAAPELIETARTAAAEDVSHARGTAQALQHQLKDINGRIQQAAQEAERRTHLTSQQRQAEQAARQQHAAARQQAQTSQAPAPTPRISGPQATSRRGTSIQ